jgi:hypothetical protein
MLDSIEKLQVQKIHYVALMTQKLKRIYLSLKENASLIFTSRADGLGRNKTPGGETVVQAS